MITAGFFTDSDGRITGFKISGHSGYKEAGSDIVCASVSSAVMLSVNTMSEQFGLELETAVPGDGELVCKAYHGSLNRDWDRLAYSLYAHLAELEKEFSENLKVVFLSEC